MTASRIVGGQRAPYTVLELLRNRVVGGELIFDSNGLIEQESDGCVLVLPGYAGAFSRVGSFEAVCSLAEQENAKVKAELVRGTDVARIRPPGAQLTPEQATRFTAALKQALAGAGVRLTERPRSVRPRGLSGS